MLHFEKALISLINTLKMLWRVNFLMHDYTFALNIECKIKLHAWLFVLTIKFSSHKALLSVKHIT